MRLFRGNLQKIVNKKGDVLPKKALFDRDGRKMLKQILIMIFIFFYACGEEAESTANNGKEQTNNGTTVINNGAPTNNSKRTNNATNTNNITSTQTNSTTAAPVVLTTGAACTYLDECSAGYCDTFFDPCDGICKAYQALGDRCDDTAYCGPTLACNIQKQECEPVKQIGDFCDDFVSHCQFGTSVCVNGKCEAYGKLDEPCISRSCEDNLYCKPGNALGLNGKCAPRTLNVGASCSPENNGCVQPLFCDNIDTKKCKMSVRKVCE